MQETLNNQVHRMTQPVDISQPLSLANSVFAQQAIKGISMVGLPFTQADIVTATTEQLIFQQQINSNVVSFLEEGNQPLGGKLIMLLLFHLGKIRD